MSANLPYRVLIVSHASWEGLSRLPHLLYKAGCEVHVLGSPGNYVSHSWFVNWSICPATDADGLVEALQVFLSQPGNKYDWILIGDDPLIYALEKRRHEAWVQAVFPTCMGDAGVDFITSKACFIQRCQQEQLSVPDFEICYQHDHLIQAGQRLGFPLVIKEAQGFAGLAVSIIDDMRSLEQFPVEHPVIAQRFINGRLGSAAAFFKNGELLAWFSYYRARTWGELGPSAAVEFSVFPELQGILKKLGQLSGFHGQCGIDFIQEAGTGKLVLLEQNFRPTLTMNLGHYVGIDCVAVMRHLLTDQGLDQLPVPQFKQDPACKALVPLFPQDVFRAIDAHDWRGLLAWSIRLSWWREISWREPKILCINLRQIAKKLIAR